MNRDKKRYIKLLYQFLVNNGILFEFLTLLNTTKHSTFKEHCTIGKPENYIINAYYYHQNTNASKTWTNYWKECDNKWREHLQQYKTKQK